jgi:phosphotriesterase-related protein
MVNTVTGPVQVKELGKTLVHEHLLFGYPGFQGDITLGALDRAAALQNCLKRGKRLRAVGVKTIVDATPNECGRNPDFLKEVSEKTGLNIICSTGYYYEGGGAPAYFRFRSTLGDIESEIYDMFMAELTTGIGKTGIKPGVIKLASGKAEISDYEKTFFKVAAKVQKETGCPIITHTEQGTMGPEQAEMLISAGVTPHKIQIGHMDGNTDIKYHLKTVSQGVSISFDRCGLQVIAGMPMDNERIDLLSKLILKGHGDRIMLSSDLVWNWLGRPLSMPEDVRKLTANWDPLNIFEHILPGLEEKGIRKELIEKLLVDNPRRLFTL